MLLRDLIRYALEQALDIETWEDWTDSPFCFNGIVNKEHRSITQIVIYHDYNEIFIYTKERTSNHVFDAISKIGSYSVYPATYMPEEEKYRVKPENTEGLVIITRYI